MREFQLTDQNFEWFAVKHYDNPQCEDAAEFLEDVNRFKYLRRLLNKYEEQNDLKVNLILNHLVVLYNLFNDAATQMLFFKVQKKHWPILVPFLIYINRMPMHIQDQHKIIRDSDIQIDMDVVRILREFNRQGC